MKRPLLGVLILCLVVFCPLLAPLVCQRRGVFEEDYPVGRTSADLSLLGRNMALLQQHGVEDALKYDSVRDMIASWKTKNMGDWFMVKDKDYWGNDLRL